MAGSIAQTSSRDDRRTGDLLSPIMVEERELWTSSQRQASSLHEISYHACFKPQLPRFFIERFSDKGDLVYDPFMGRGTTIIEAALLERRAVGNDINPLSIILTKPRLNIPNLDHVRDRLERIPSRVGASFASRFSMFFHKQTEEEITALRTYLHRRNREGKEDPVDEWIRMVATNRLTGHSTGFFSVYTLPPNQATSPERQRKINRNRKQRPEYRAISSLILRKSKSLLRKVSESQHATLNVAGQHAMFFSEPAWATAGIPDECVQLTVTSPPFLDIVNYRQDNWLRCWFNVIDSDKVSREITMTRKLNQWSESMAAVFRELYRITKPGGFVAFEVGEIRKKSLRLEETVIPLGQGVGFTCQRLFINAQRFTKTANIWGITNNELGTNTNRIALFQKQ
jgi:hypothetical protein